MGDVMTGRYYYEYVGSVHVLKHVYALNMGNPFFTLVMAAMREADTDNMDALQAAFPDVWEELQMRYNAPGGKLEGEL